MAAGGKLPTVLVANRQRKVRLDVQRLRELASESIRLCLTRPGGETPTLPSLEEVEVALVSDRVIDQVHRRFMDIRGATDVITFAHGEIVVSVDTAAREAEERGEPLERETLRYIVHGLLHLNGHEDAEVEEAASMWKAQEAVVELLWPKK